MTTLDQMQESQDPIHLLLIARSKVGKSTFAAQAAIDGLTVLYIDSDNGRSALMHHLHGNVEAQKRVHYVQTDNPVEFLTELFDSPRLFRWDLGKDIPYSPTLSYNDSKVLHIDIPRFLKLQRTVLVIDSWSSVQYQAMQLSAKRVGVDLTDMDRASMPVYGGALQRLNSILFCLQHMPQHALVLAHGTYYERYEKPVNTRGVDMRQKDMTLVETIEVPISSSRPHGVEMVKFFNHVAWLLLDKVGRVKIDYTRSPSRVGGGPPNRIANIEELRFAHLLTRELLDDANEMTPDMIYEKLVSEIKADKANKADTLPNPRNPSSAPRAQNGSADGGAVESPAAGPVRIKLRAKLETTKEK